jgi:DNA repair protein SbcC/Rad50
MNLLKRLFKKTPPKIATLEEQIQALGAQTDTQLAEVAASGADDQLREAAIAKLGYDAQLLELAIGQQSNRIQIAARKRICQLLDDQQLQLSQVAQDIPKQLELMAVVSYSASASAQALADITSPLILLELASDANTTQIRQAAAAQINTREQLEQLAKTAQAKDKNVYKLVKAKLDEFKALDVQQATIEANGETLCGKMEKHIHQEADALFKAKLTLLQQEWAPLASQVSSATNLRYSAALKACEAKIQAQADAIAQEEENLALDQQAMNFALSALEDVKQLAKEIYSASHIDELLAVNYQQRLQELTQALRLAANRNLPLDTISKEFEQRKQQALQLLDQIKTSGSVQQLMAQLQEAKDSELVHQTQHKLNQLIKQAKDLGDDLPEIVEQAKATLQRWNQERRELEQSAKSALRDFSELTRKGLWAAEQGFVRKARGIQKDLAEKRQQLAELPKAMEAKWEDFEQQLAKLGDWHEFAVTPKKEALVSQMQELVGSAINPEHLATKIHELQDNWKEVSKGGQQQDDQLWNQFQEASKAAYVPCKEFFDAQAAVRDANLAKREEMVAQLHSYLGAYDWENAQWKEVEKTLKVARQEWQTYWPVPRKAGNELQKEFENLMEQLFTKISDEYQANKAAKQALIEQAQQLENNTDLRSAIESVKQLQAQWKKVGKCRYKDDQELWQVFRQYCDAVFVRKDQEANALNQERLAQQQQAEALLARLAAISSLELTAINEAKAEVAAITGEFNGLELPRDQAKLLHNQLQERLHEISNTINAERNKAETQSWLDLFATADAIRDFEAAILQQQDSAQISSLKTELTQRIAQTPRWPNGFLSALQQRIAGAEKLDSAQQEQYNQALRLVTIRAEILTGRETPVEDKNLRMAYQVQQMQQAFGQQQESATQLLNDWISTAGADTATYASLSPRFTLCRQLFKS